jgi:tripartite ATP-independent transporter DctM subunit
MALTGIVLMTVNGNMRWGTLLQHMLAGVNTFTILAIPMFLLAGKLMNIGGITRRLFDFCMKLVGWLPGGLGHVNVLASVIFAGMSGTAVSDAGGLGSIEIQAMREKGFDDGFSCGVTAASSTLGPIIPPSVPLVIYGTVSGASVGALFMAGLVPGILMAVIMMIVVTIFAIIRKYPRTQFPKIREIFVAFREGFFPLMAPVIILVGIYTGAFTPTESAVIVVFYSLILSFLMYREMTWFKLLRILRETVRDSLTIAMLIAGATFFGYVVVRIKIPQMVLEMMTSVVSSQTGLLSILTVFLLVIGCFMETASAITILVPLILPLLNAYQVDPVHFGISMVLNLMIGLLTPPFGLVLFVVAKIGNMSVGRLTIALLPWMVALFVALFLVTFIPQISLALPRYFGLM